YKITLLWQHDTKDPIGQITVLKEDDYGLYFEAKIDDVPNGTRALRQIKSGTLNQFSIGFNYVWDQMEYNDDTDTIIVREIELFEGSVVTIASNAETYAMRSPEQLTQDADDLLNDTEDFIKTIPRKQQLELRQLIAKHISIAQVRPLALRQKAPDPVDPDEQEQAKPNFKNILNII
ncbi:MAG: HK97 family phage prohead protease, partial [Bacteroidetes bacterium]|nr:HK97 family phage prohead protease [Bacteroidota bacterium]